MTTDQPPDAVRAAIAEAAYCSMFKNDPEAEQHWNDPESGINRFVFDRLGTDIYDRLAQIGAVPAAGEEGVTKADLKQAVRYYVGQSLVFYDEPTEGTMQERKLAGDSVFALIDRLPIANGADDGA